MSIRERVNTPGSHVREFGIGVACTTREPLVLSAATTEEALHETMCRWSVVAELQLNGHAIERVYDHGRPRGVPLLAPERPEAPAAFRRLRRRWPDR